MIRKEVKLLVNTIDKVKTFVNINSRFDCTVDVISGRYVIDGKSIMGMFSLDLSKQLAIVIEAENAEDVTALIKLYEENELVA